MIALILMSLVRWIQMRLLVGNVDTLVDDANIENKCDQVFIFAHGEGQHPLSLYQDTDAEYLCFPSLFCGQRRPVNEERVVPVHYTDIVKWELRSIYRKAAQTVTNIFSNTNVSR